MVKMFAAVPILQMGLARKLVCDRSVKYRTRITKDLVQFLLLLSILYG